MKEGIHSTCSESITALLSPHPPLALGKVLFDLRADGLMDVLVQGRVACNPTQHRADTTTTDQSPAWCLECVTVYVKETVLNVLYRSVRVYVWGV